MNGQLSKIRLVYTYVCYAQDGLFWMNLYTEKEKSKLNVIVIDCIVLPKMYTYFRVDFAHVY